MRIGIICPSEIAFRRFLPALKKMDFDYHRFMSDIEEFMISVYKTDNNESANS